MLSFRLFAGTNVGLRENNEDNFTVCPDVAAGRWIIPTDCTTAIDLGPQGCVLVVADGMGGQNAGEVASDIAVKTVEEMFAPGALAAALPQDGDRELAPAKVCAYMCRVVEEADERVKHYGQQHAEAEGLGSTIVMAWVLGTKAYVAWLGDSRAYSYRHGSGIGRLSKDHSYVQQLVDKGMLSDDEAMHHPQSNIITRSLGDTSKRARAEVVEQQLADGEILLLCSDGLCGVCSDEQIGSILMEVEHGKTLQQCKDLLTEAALAAGGSDNITIALLQVCSGGVAADDSGHDEASADAPDPDGLCDKGKWSAWTTPKNIAVLAAACAFAALLTFACLRMCDGPKREHPKTDAVAVPTDTKKARVDTSKNATEQPADTAYIQAATNIKPSKKRGAEHGLAGGANNEDGSNDCGSSSDSGGLTVSTEDNQMGGLTKNKKLDK